MHRPLDISLHQITLRVLKQDEQVYHYATPLVRCLQGNVPKRGEKVCLARHSFDLSYKNLSLCIKQEL